MKVKLDAQHYEWLSDDIRAEISFIVDNGHRDDELLDCVNDLVFIKTLCEDGTECGNDNQLLELGKQIETMARKYDETSDIRVRTIPGKKENEGIIFIYE